MSKELIYLISFVLVLGLFGVTYAQQRDADISYAETPPIIDGVVDNVWSLSAEHLVAIIREEIAPTLPADCSANWRALWDPEYLYVLVDVNDEALVQDSDPAQGWHDDRIEVFVDGDNSKSPSTEDNDYQYNFRWNYGAVETPVEWYNPPGSLEGVEYAVVTTDSGYLFEIKLPWSTMIGGAPQAGQLIGIDVMIDDDDDGGNRDTQISWHTEPGGSPHSPTRWGTAWLVPGKMASNPSPADGAIHAGKWIGLSWTPGISAVSHDVYMGENFADVSDGTGDTFRRNEATTNIVAGFPGYPYPDGLIPGTTYYWRIDEVEADGTTIHKGDVWSFSIAPYTAYNPNPPDGARFIYTDPTLSWAAGMEGKLHHVYFGDNSADVDAGTGDTYKGPVPLTTYTPSTLEFGKTYYWRVDEFDGLATHKGDLWSFSTIPVFAIADPNLVAWWKLDEGIGDMVVDWSGHAHHGKISGDVKWIEGIDGGALEFRGGIVEMLDYEGVLGTHDRTVTAWIKTTAYGDIVSWGVTTEPGQKWIVLVNGNVNNGTFEALRTECAGSRIIGSTVLTDGQWHHVASVLESTGAPTINNIKLYVDGQREAISDSLTADLNTVSEGRKVWLGEGHHNRPFPGRVDDIRIYDKALTLEGIKLTMRGDLRLAWDPKPANKSTPNIKDATPLSWSPGDNAAQHDVYFGTDKTAVSNADTSDTSGIYRGRQAATSHSPTEGVEWGGGPYYWRIDEYNTDATVSTGRVWTFTVADYLTVDDFESYNDLEPADLESNRIYLTWMDGYEQPTNGSQVGYTDPPFCEQSIVHGGRQSAPLIYDNSAASYSEATADTANLQIGRDWTAEGVKALVLWFRGEPANTAAPMYVVLNGSAVVYHDNPDAAQRGMWTEWYIELQAFADQGVNLANVNTITIGLGDKTKPPAGGSGTVYFDDIRLYRPR